MRHLIKIGVTVFLFISCGDSKQNTADHSQEPIFGLGRPAPDSLIQKWDTDIRPDGKGLPDGAGVSSTGEIIFNSKCISCHGRAGTDATFGRLVAAAGDTVKAKSIGNYWPYATTIFDYIKRAMPFNQPGSLTDQEVYDLTAYLLAENKIIADSMVIDASSLPKIEMPAKSRYVTDDRHGGNEIK